MLSRGYIAPVRHAAGLLAQRAFLRAATSRGTFVLGVWPAGEELTTIDRAESSLSVVPGTGVL